MDHTEFFIIYRERKSSESERDKTKSYDLHRYAENENPEKESHWRSYNEVTEKTRPFTSGSPRQGHVLSENENRERKSSREEGYENSRPHVRINAEFTQCVP